MRKSLRASLFLQKPKQVRDVCGGRAALPRGTKAPKTFGGGFQHVTTELREDVVIGERLPNLCISLASALRCHSPKEVVFLCQAPQYSVVSHGNNPGRKMSGLFREVARNPGASSSPLQGHSFSPSSIPASCGARVVLQAVLQQHHTGLHGGFYPEASRPQQLRRIRLTAKTRRDQTTQLHPDNGPLATTLNRSTARSYCAVNGAMRAADKQPSDKVTTDVQEASAIEVSRRLTCSNPQPRQSGHFYCSLKRFHLSSSNVSTLVLPPRDLRPRILTNYWK